MSLARLTVICQFVLLVAGALCATPLNVVVTGETHAMLSACDCARNPGGGFSKRATILRQMRESGDLLLLDGGAFCGGGLYDAYTAGRAGDSLRSLAAIAAMGALRYDAVAIGDDDLQYGSRWLVDAARKAAVPLVSANCFKPDGKSLVPRYILIKKGPLTIGVTAVLTDERLFDTEPGVLVRDPFSSLHAIWPELVKKSDAQVIISHCGEAMTLALADSFPGSVFMVNGHRRNGIDPLVTGSRVPVIQFTYQGKALCAGRIEKGAASIRLADCRWVPVSNEIPDDPALDRLLAAFVGVVPEHRVYDLYIMGQCPYGLEVLPQFLGFVNRFTERIEWSIRLVGTVESNGDLSSLHGPAEVAVDKMLLAVQALHPGQWRSFLLACAKADARPSEVARTMGMDTAALDQWVRTRGDAALKVHFLRSMRMGINASPTLTINNTPSDVAPDSLRLAREECSQSPRKASFCDSLPACIDDADCRQPGKRGRCSGSGTKAACVFTDAIHFNFTIVSADSIAGDDEEGVINRTRDLFPGAAIQRIMIASAKGKELIGSLKPDALPLYLFDREVSKDSGFGQIHRGIRDAGQFFTFQSGVIRSSYYYQRKEIKGSLVLYVDPLFDRIGDILGVVDSSKIAALGLRIRPIITEDPDQDATNAAQRLRQEEAGRWLVLANQFPAAFVRYLDYYRKKPGSSWWQEYLNGSGINPEQLAGAVQNDSLHLKSLRDDLRSLDINEPVVLLADNRRLFVIKGVADLNRLLAELSHRN